MLIFWILDSFETYLSEMLCILTLICPRLKDWSQKLCFQAQYKSDLIVGFRITLSAVPCPCGFLLLRTVLVLAFYFRALQYLELEYYSALPIHVWFTIVFIHVSCTVLNLNAWQLYQASKFRNSVFFNMINAVTLVADNEDREVTLW